LHAFQIVDELDARFSEEAQQQLINVFLEHYGAEIGMAPIEPAQGEDMQAEEFGDEEAHDEGMDYDETQDLPEEEDDLGKLQV
jgi:hypothetical protein